MASKAECLQFVPFQSFLDAGFWHKLSQNKLNVYGIDESYKKIHGFYFNGDLDGLPCRLNVGHDAFDKDLKIPQRRFISHGTLFNTNTIDKFKESDKKELLSVLGKEIQRDIISGNALKEPSLLSQFFLLTFADLKKYIFYYWFAFPCICIPTECIVLKQSNKLKDVFNFSQISSFTQIYDDFQRRNKDVGFFIVDVDNDVMQIDKVEKIADYNHSKLMFGFCDPSTLDKHPGWPLRNYLALLAYHCPESVLQSMKILCFRDQSKDGKRDIGNSMLLTLQIDPQTIKKSPDDLKFLGWEKNERQKLGPRMVNLSSTMDPAKLAESAVDLNLKLMRWRLLPELDLETVSSTKCLLLGAGTLGCNVARCLLGWGVRKITLVDNGKVSYSNPVRQTLFTFEDCMQGGQPKAETAADSLKKIFPGVDATGISLSIPMPGHPVTESSIKSTRADVEKLSSLIQSHDAVFLLLDTRESRWLPTVMAAAYNKIVICAALGFDTFLVMRHGVRTEETYQELPSDIKYSNIPGHHLGCYFCNDVVAPGNSTRDRTLDQQCTVSRPGMSFLASSLAVEILVSLLQHPLRGRAPADTSANDEHLTKELSCSLGIIPHQIRTFLSRFNQVLPACMAFDKCTACSRKIIEMYQQDGFDFLLRVFNETGTYLEDLTGLTQMHQETIDTDVWALSDDESGSEMEVS